MATFAQGNGLAEPRLLEIYRLFATGRSREALDQAAELVQDFPNFQLAQLVYGDLLSARTRTLQVLGDVPPAMQQARASTLEALRAESRQRVQALYTPPPAGTVPTHFLQVSESLRHVIAVDASRSRLYLFENQADGLGLIADFYISVGKAGVAKRLQGDQRTPLGVYFIISSLDPRHLGDAYGPGAMPIDYPNPLDRRRGNTGSGIWLHGTPPDQFSRAPQASDGCLVMANPDLAYLTRTMRLGGTPVVIAPWLQWVKTPGASGESQQFVDTLQAWRKARVAGNVQQFMSYYSRSLDTGESSLAHWTALQRKQLQEFIGQTLELRNLSILQWSDSEETMVVSFQESFAGKPAGQTKRQYWTRQSGQWKIFFEGLLE